MRHAIHKAMQGNAAEKAVAEKLKVSENSQKSLKQRIFQQVGRMV